MTARCTTMQLEAAANEPGVAALTPARPGHEGDAERSRMSEAQVDELLVERVQHISFSGARAREQGQQVIYVTERAVFELRPDGIELTEAAPGVDVQADILDRMRFRPIVRGVKPMPLD